MKKYSLLLFTVLFFMGSHVIAQTSSSDSLRHRISVLEDYKQNLDQRYANSEAALKNQIDAKLEESSKDIKDAKLLLKWLLFVGMPLTLGGFLLIYFQGIKKAKKIVADKIANIIEHNREEIIRLIESQEFETKLRTTKNIVVISPNATSEQSIKQIMTKFKFKSISYRVDGSYTQLPAHDLIVFNNYDGTFNQQTIDDYLRNIPDDDIHFVAYCKILPC